MFKSRTASIKEGLLKTLEDLGDKEFKKFKWFLQDSEFLGDFPVIPKSQLENADRIDTVDKIYQTHNHQSPEVVKKILEKIRRFDLVHELSDTNTEDGDVFYQNLSPTKVLTLLGSTLSKAHADAPIIDIPSVYKDLIANSYRIRSRSPAVYQLRPKKEKFGTLTRMTLGEKDPVKKNKTILLVGETGAGKSTLVNALVNYAMGVKWENDVWFQIVKEDKRRQSKSQTSDVIVYQIFGFEDQTLPYSLTIIDTPGYGDSRGNEQDVFISQRLLDLFRSDDGVHEINAVGLVLKASDSRLNDRMRYIFDSAESLFGKNMEKNIVALITHSDGRTPKNALKALKAANIKCAEDKKNQPVHFLFDNCQSEDRTVDTESLQYSDTVTTGGMSQFTDFLGKTAPKKMEKTVDVLKERMSLTVCIQGFELKQKEIQQTQDTLRKYEKGMKRNKNFTEEIDGSKIKKRISGRGLLGLGCGLLNYEDVCDNCQEVMKDGSCPSCDRKCSESDHVDEKKIDETTKTRKANQAMNDVNDLEKKMEELEKEKHKLLEESLQHIAKLEKIALNVDSLSTLVHLDFLIEKMKETGDKEKVQKLEEMKSRGDVGTGAILRYKQTAAGKEGMKNTSSKFKDIISKSVRIQSGSPAVYQLKPKEQDAGTVRRMILGEKDLNKTNRTILLVGETGAGKSTLVNALVNYTMGVKWEDDVWFQIVEEEKRRQSESQTSDVIVYQIFGFEGKTLPYSLTIIDTPGYGSTGGIDLDDNISQSLFDLFSSDDGVHEINAVGLVLKASDSRLSDRLMYIFDSVVSLFGKNMEKKIVALITHSDGLTPENVLQALENANIKCARNEENEILHFVFNNCQSTQKKKKKKCNLKSAWDLTIDEIGHFTDFLEKTAPQKMIKTVEVLKTRTRLTACAKNLQDRIELTELQQREIHQTQEALKKHEQEMKNNENFTVEVEEVYRERENNNKAATCCTVCKENCHLPCRLALKPVWCDIMKKGRCTVCTWKCPASAHEKEKKIYVNKIKKVKKTLQEVKEKYEKSKSDCEETTNLLESLEKRMEELQKEKDQMLDESFDHVVKLEQIALNVDSLSTLVHLDFLIEKMKEKGDTEKVQKLEEMKRRVDGNKQQLVKKQ